MVYSIMGLLVFLVIQVVVLFIFYRVVIRPLPGQINDLLFKVHLQNDFTKISSDTADLVRIKLLELEAERLEALVQYEALKGLRLNTTDNERRKAYKRSCDRLTKQIAATQNSLNKLYAPTVLSQLRRFEELRFVAAINRWLDAQAAKRAGGNF